MVFIAQMHGGGASLWCMGVEVVEVHSGGALLSSGDAFLVHGCCML